ncbi:leucine-rich repeat-containing protein 14 [Sardina pilchardus]|uniref:leucine-rich repeat-containing protein 14 n=1 Tax=Sardina pilchardus TaxID=27697 RepID=UPI002E13C49C
MVFSLVDLCAKEVVSDHSSSPSWLGSVPRELYGPLLEAAFTYCRPLAIGELVQRWPERALAVGKKRRPGQNPPNRLCVQALLLAVVRGLADKRSALQLLDLCGLQCEDECVEDSMGGWSLTVALCSMVLQATVAAQKGVRKEGERERERKRSLETERTRDSAIKRDRGSGGRGVEVEKGSEEELESKGLKVDRLRDLRVEEGGGEVVMGVRRRMEMQKRSGSVDLNRESSDLDPEPVLLHVCADLFVNARSWERVRGALTSQGPLRLHCRYLRVEELPAPSIAALLSLLPELGLRGLDIRYSSLGVSGLALLLPLLAPFPHLRALKLHYCNLDLHRALPGQEGALKDMSQGLGGLKGLRHLSLTALRLPGHLRLLLSSLSQPLEVLELPYLSLTPADLSYLSCSPHASSLQRLDLSENRLDESSLPSLRRLLSQATLSLVQLSLCGCGLSDGLLAALLPSLSCCRALQSLRLALNPLSLTGLLSLVRTAAGIPSLRLLLYPNPLEEYEVGLPPMPSSAQLLDWPLAEEGEIREAILFQLEELLRQGGRSGDLFLTADLLNFTKDLLEVE